MEVGSEIQHFMNLPMFPRVSGWPIGGKTSQNAKNKFDRSYLFLNY